MPIRLVLADDHPLILEALAQLFEPHPDFLVLAQCASVAETLQAVRQHRPDVLLLDLCMPEAGGLAVLRQIKKEELYVRVVLLTGVADEDAMLEAIHLGVCGVVLKDTPPEVVLQCVRAVHAGAQWLERRSISQALEGLLRLEARRRQSQSGLTPRELEIVQLVEAGLRNKEIADRLSLSEGTVKVYLNRIFEKFHVANRLELMRYARDNGLV